MNDLIYPLGVCQCGCGARTSVAKRTVTGKQIIKGQHLRYLPGHRGGRRLPDGRLRCTYCKQFKEPDDFAMMKRATHKRSSYCKDCLHDAYTKVRKKKAQYKIKYQLQKLYGLTLEQYHQMFEDQKGVCSICKQPELARRKDGSKIPLHVDHDHVTGLVRSLLCQCCNQGLGHFKDNVQLILKAADYISYHQRKQPCPD